MARIRSNNVFGTVTDDPLTDSATTLNSAGLANLAAVSGGDEAIITLDPNRVNGAPEIVRVTAHTGSATSATIDRGEFDTSAREHPAGTEWVHGAVAATSSDPDGDFGGIWEPWTPTFTNFTLGNGTRVARFTRIGNTIHFRLHLILGNSSSMGDIRFSPPVAANTSGQDGNTSVGQVVLVDTGTATYAGTVVVVSSTSFRVFSMNGAANGQLAVLSSAAPMTWTTGDVLTVVGSYEAA